ncbi:MAG: hypothetical protein AAF936_08185 [Pseudomonadota bacterium]
MFEDAVQQMSQLSRPVQLWMRWLNIVLLPAFYFAFEFEAARWVLAANLIGLPVGLLAFAVTRNIHMTGLPHILFWTPLLAYLLHSVASDPAFHFASLYAFWLLLYGTTIAISLVFDIRALTIYLTRRSQRAANQNS